MCELHAHVAQSAETNHSDLLALGDAPVPHGRVGGDSGAKQWSGSGRVEVRGNMQDKPLVNYHTVGVATVGNASEMLVGKVVREGSIRAELLKARLAFGASAV